MKKILPLFVSFSALLLSSCFSGLFPRPGSSSTQVTTAEKTTSSGGKTTKSSGTKTSGRTSSTTGSTHTHTSSGTSVTPTTSVEPTTTSAPTTSVEPTTTSAPTTSAEPTTTSAPTTSVEPTTSVTPTTSVEATTTSGTTHTHTTSSSTSIEPIIGDGFEIYFLELGSWYTGDSIFIKAGDNDILIDAGSKQSSGAYIVNYLKDNELVTDNKLEYVISTHAHEDHISGFVGNTVSGQDVPRNGVFYSFEVGTLIQFARTDKDPTKGLYKNYLDAVEYLKSNGTKVYDALTVNKSKELNTISLGENLSMQTLYQKYYEESSSTENDYSVCTLFTCGSQHFLFTGDLEKSGEESLVESNTLPHCELYKAGHHGSNTSSSAKLMETITPEVVCVCCCCGSTEYTKTDANQFPTQEFINRVGIYTDAIYVTTISIDNEERKYASMNGVIKFSSNGKKYNVSCSNNSLKIKDTEWFKNHRVWPTE